jgi:hypothetical protein
MLVGFFPAFPNDDDHNTFMAEVRGSVRCTLGLEPTMTARGPEYRYLDWYATANTDYVSTRSTFAT